MTHAEYLLQQELALRAEFERLFPNEGKDLTLFEIEKRLRLQRLETIAVASRFSDTADDTQRIMSITEEKFGVGKEVGDPSKSNPNKG